MLKYGILFALFGVAIAPSFAHKPRPCQVTGNIKGLGNKAIVFSYERDGKSHQDTVRAINDRFSYVAHPSDDGTFTLYIAGPRFTQFWHEPGKLTATGSINKPAQLTIVGTPENALLTQYNQQIGWKFNQRMVAHPDSMLALRQLAQRPTLNFIKAHPQSRTSANLLYLQAIYDDKPTAEYEQLLRGLSASVQASPQGQKVARRLLILKNQPIVGRPVPGFTMPDTAGVAVSLDRFKGQYVLLDFWGHWCGPCIRAMPHLKALQSQYARELAVVGIGMEAADDKKLWMAAIRKHQANWTQLSELKGDKGVIEQYNITGFPTYLLLDKQGIVLERGRDLGPIEEKLKALLAKP
ncbi:alkyl hydroperoxide reductase/ Thiol specific antioxidant/ Mal allergen [Hymenobacter roseosalivarius DSM 11622]|uniref:Alkyl hydroperoxide reductase/ Thiol specific antioxidant/ Mal allergen n=1 Tax=Hymenobacter roseosalivarius DSM 11622 TaxID=645990 RepID=A0A1W1W0P2_9BACT|nr:TlpA disulfide reductase family protein [Hymenobacter roseosalivarius]SMB99146.1 alkyl hydroperoxide reductase/ Thiol specific antioxidant/ Mal allergen [Hymenobacter roseosalivarius DSM 11622]